MPEKKMIQRKRAPGKVALILLLIAILPCWYLWRLVHDSLLRDDLFAAIRSNDIVRVRAQLKAGADPNLRESPPRMFGLAALIDRILNPNRNPQQPTPLLVALYHMERSPSGQLEIQYNPFPNPEIVRALLEKGADATATDDAHITPLWFGVVSGNVKIVDLLLKHGATYHEKDVMGASLLLSSASQGRVEMMRYLLAHGADIQERNALGETALIYTVRYARLPDAVKLLLDHHIDVNARDRSGKTALFYARTPDPRLAPSQTFYLPKVIAQLKQAGAQ